MKLFQLFLASALVALALPACTPSAAQTATQVATVAEDICIPIVSAAAPAEEPLCVLGEELASAIIAYIQSHAGTAPSVATSSGGATAVGPDLYDALRSRPAVASRKSVKARCPKLPAGSVAP